MPDHAEYHGFIRTYKTAVKSIFAPINLLPISSTDKALRTDLVDLAALWDTGATLTFMKPYVQERLKLYMARTNSSKTIAVAGGIFKADFTVVSFLLAPNFEIDMCPVYVLDFPGKADILIGMDIIGMGDFAVCNAAGKTSFSFAMPPFPDRINLAEKAEAANRQAR